MQFQTYYRGEVNADLKTPDGDAYKQQYQFPHAPDRRYLNDPIRIEGQNRLFAAKDNGPNFPRSKFPNMLGIVGDDIDQDDGSVDMVSVRFLYFP